MPLSVGDVKDQDEADDVAVERSGQTSVAFLPGSVPDLQNKRSIGPEIHGLCQFATGSGKSALSVKCCPALILMGLLEEANAAAPLDETGWWHCRFATVADRQSP